VKRAARGSVAASRSAAASVVAVLLLAACGRDGGAAAPDQPAAPAGMVFVPGGEFEFGSDAPWAWQHERPAHRVRVSGFFMDAHEVTNAQFARFGAETGRVTVAERPVDWEELRRVLPPGTPRPSDAELAPGALVFVAPTTAAVPRDVSLADVGQWWNWVPGACWRQPEGPGSGIDARGDHPVVHVAHADALAFAAWAGKRLPTEAEWEFAARGGLVGARFVWGDEDVLAPPPRANVWQGVFPTRNSAEDGHVGTAPVGSFAPNGYGLFDMAGNVWEWTSDWYAADAHAQAAARRDLPVDPRGPAQPWNPNAPHERQRVTKGGSFLCHPSYCDNYRPSSRMGTEESTALAHTGFRCVRDLDAD